MAYTSRYGADHGGGFANIVEVDPLNQGHYALGGDVYGCRQTLDGGNRWFGSNQGMAGSFQVGRAIGFSKRPTTSGTVFWGFGGLHASDGGGYFGYSDMGGYSQHILDSANGFGNSGYGGGGAGSSPAGNAVRPNYEGIITDYNSGNDTEYIYTLTATGFQRYTNAGANAGAISGATKLLTAAQMGGASYWVGACLFDSNHIVVVRYDFSYTAALRPSVVYMITSSAASLRVATAGQVSITPLTLPSGVGAGHVYHIKKGLDGHFYAACGYDGAFEVALSGSNLTWTDTGVTNDILVCSVDAASDRTLWVGQAGGTTAKTSYANASNGTPSGHGVIKGAWGGSSWTFSFPVNSGNTHGAVYQPGDTTLSTGDLWYLWSNGPDLLSTAYDTSIVRVDPFNDSKILLTGRSGQWQSRDNGAHWYPAMRGLNGGEIDAIRTTGARSASAGNLTTGGNFDWDEVHTTDQWRTCVRKVGGVVAAGNGKVFGSSGPQTWPGDDGKTYTYTESTGAGGSSIKQGSTEIGDAHFRGAAVHAQAGAVASDGTVMIALFGGTIILDPNTTPPALPTITSFTPTTQAVGATVSVTGTNFTGASNVTINGTAASFTVNSATSITVTVPTGATTGPIIVVTSAGASAPSANLTISGSSGGGAPTISSFTPTTAAPGDTVTVTGTNFTGATVVKVGTLSASFNVVSSTSITLTVPTSAVSGKITVTATGGTIVSSGTLTVSTGVSAPTITSFTPSSGVVGDTVTVTGTNFTSASSVKVNTTSASFTVVSGTSITLTIPNGSTSGKITVTTPGGTVVSSGTLTVSTGGGGTSPFVRVLDQQAPTGTGTTATLTIPTGGVPVGHTVIVGVGSNHVAVTGVTDSRGNTYTSDAAVLPATATAASMWSAPVTTALLAADTITVTYSTSVGGRSAIAAEYQYITANDPGVTGTASSTAFTNTSASKSVATATAQSNTVIVSFVCIGGSGSSAGTVSAGSSLTRRATIEQASGTQRAIGLADRSLTSTLNPVATSWSWTAASGYSLLQTAYKVTPPGGGGTGSAPVVRQFNVAENSSPYTASTKTLPAWSTPTLAGSRIVVIVGQTDNGNPGIGVSVSGAGAYQQSAKSPVIRSTTGGPQVSLRDFHLLNAPAAVPPPVITWSGMPGAGIYFWAVALEITGSHPSVLEDTSDTDAQSVATGAAQQFPLGPVGPTTRDGVLWLAAWSLQNTDAVTLAPGSGFSTLATGTSGAPASPAKYSHVFATSAQTLAGSKSVTANLAAGAGGPQQFPLGPPSMTGWTTLTDPDPSTTWTPSLTNGTHYILKFPAQRTAPVLLNNGGNVTLDGLLTRLAANAAYMVGFGGGDTGRIITIQNSQLDPNGFQSDAIKTLAGSDTAILQLKNVRVETLIGHTAGTHADLVQTSGGLGELWVEDFTGHTTYDGFMLQREANIEQQTTTWSITSLTASGTTGTAVIPSHGLSVGDAFGIFNCTVGAWNGGWTVLTVSGSGATKQVTFQLGDQAPANATSGSAIKFDWAYNVGDINLNRVNVKGFANSFGDPTEALQSIRFGARTAPTANPGNPGASTGYTKQNEDQTPLNVDWWAGKLTASNWYAEPPSGNVGQFVEPDNGSANYSVARPVLHSTAPAYADWPLHPSVTAGTRIQQGPPPGGDYVVMQGGVPVSSVAPALSRNYAALLVAVPSPDTGGGGGGGGGGTGVLPDTNDGTGHFARSGHYFPAITSGAGRTAVQNAQWIAGRCDIVIETVAENASSIISIDKYSGQAGAMQSTNPDIILSVYGKGPQIDEGASFFPNTYYAHQTPWPSGAKIPTTFSPNILRAQPYSPDQPSFADPRGFTASSFRDYRAKNAQHTINTYNTLHGAGTLNSWFYDSSGSVAYSTLIADPLNPTQTYQAAYPDGRTAYLDLVDTIPDTAKATLGSGYIVIVNGLGSGAGYYNNLNRLLSHCDVGYAEVWLKKNYVTPANAWPVETDWQQSIDMLVHANTVLGKGVICVQSVANATSGTAPTGWVDWTQAQIDQGRRFCFASYMLGKRDQCWFEYVPTAPTGDYTEDDPWYHVDLGAPLDNPPVDASGHGAAVALKTGAVYQRHFTFGSVYVNPTPAAVSFVLDQAYYQVAADGSASATLYGAAGSTQTLAAHDAVIVYIGPNPGSNTSAPVGTITAPPTTVSTPDVVLKATYTDPDGDTVASAQARNFTNTTTWTAMTQAGGVWSAPLTLTAGANVLQTRATDGNASPLTSSPIQRTVTYTAVTPSAPVNSTPPVIPTDLMSGVPFSVDPGTWTNNPTTYTYTLQRRPSTGGTFATVQADTTGQYTPTDADVGYVFRASVVASNGANSSSVNSNVSNPVQPAALVTLQAVEE